MTLSSENILPIIKSAEPLINSYGYFAVAGLVMLEDFGLPLPGETTLIAAAVLAGLGHLNIILVVIVAILAAIVGDNIGYAIGSFLGRAFFEKYGRYVFLTKSRLEKAEEIFNRNGGKVVVVARFIDGLRQLNGIIAGVSNMTWRKFIIFNSIGATAWVMVWSGLGYFGGSHIQSFLKYQLYITVLVIAAIILFLIRFGIKRMKSRRAKS